VYYKALDDSAGQAAIISTIDAADAAHPFDFFGVIEAQGDTPAGNFTTWAQYSTTLQRLDAVTSRSKYELIALCFNPDRWVLNYSLPGEFEPGRPFLVAQFLSKSATDKPVWVAAVHLNHYFLGAPPHVDTVVPGAVLARALTAASTSTGADLTKSSVIMFGDWNEFEWADFPQPYKNDAVTRMAPLWDGFFGGIMADAVAARTVSCCTKWAAGDRGSTNYTEWRFEYDHIFYSPDLTRTSPGSPFLPYRYPGVAQPCADAACTGEDPPGNRTATSQGSWHRAVHAMFERSGADDG
jgi:hypothetical protein